MKHLFLFEKFALKEKEKDEAIDNLKKFGTPSEVVSNLYVTVGWFQGRMMGNSGENKEAMEALKKVGEIYKHPVKVKHVYRTAHLHLDEKGLKTEDVKKITNGQSGPSRLQSWARNKAGAEWFFKHFVREQNRLDAPKQDATWVILKTDINNLEGLVTFEGCMQFISDVVSGFDYVDGHFEDDVEKYDIKSLLMHFCEDEMIKLHEIICFAPQTVDFDVAEVVVPPSEDAKPQKFGPTDDDMSKLLSLFIKMDRQKQQY